MKILDLFYVSLILTMKEASEQLFPVGALGAIGRAIQICFEICCSSNGLEMAALQSRGV